MTDDDRDLIEPYLIWSHEHGAWWGPGGSGYVTRIGQAGRYSRTEAMRICTRAIPGNLGALPELPVRLADLEQMVEAYVAKFGDHPERDRWR
jgi:hypothetical protein